MILISAVFDWHTDWHALCIHCQTVSQACETPLKLSISSNFYIIPAFKAPVTGWPLTWWNF